MMKFWMTMFAILALRSMTGCPDDTDDCASDPALCDSDTDTDTGADADSDMVEDDADTTPETDGTYLDFNGTWNFIFYEEAGEPPPVVITLEQSGDHLTGDSGLCLWDGNISGGQITLRGNCTRGGDLYEKTVTSNVLSVTHMEGNWHNSLYFPGVGTDGTWLADRQ